MKFGISFTLTHLNQAGALVHVYQDGSVHLNHGGTEMGQGLYIKVAQVVAEEFGIELDRVKITATTTAKVPNTSPTAASSGSDLNGMAAQIAARHDQATGWPAYAARLSRSPPAEVAFRDGQRVRRQPESIAFAELAKRACMARISLSATGFYATPKITWDRAKATGRPFFYFAYGAACSEVTIDTLTGEMRVDSRRHPARRRPLAQSGDRHRPDRGRLRAGHGLAHHRGAGLRRRRPAAHPRALDLQDPGRLRRARPISASRFFDGRQSRGHDLPLQGGRRAAADAGDLGVRAIADAIHSLDPGGDVALDAPATPEAILRGREGDAAQTLKPE